MTKRKFSLRSLLLGFAMAAVTLALGVALWNDLPDAHTAAVRNQYLAGQITLEEAVSEVGDVAYDWVELKTRRDDSSH
jgi:hypothetical protein